jgi:hypothetical protein
MNNNLFENIAYREVDSNDFGNNKRIIKSSEVKINGYAKIEMHEEGHDGMKIILKKDEYDNIKQIKFVCSCGETKSIFLDFSEE